MRRRKIKINLLKPTYLALIFAMLAGSIFMTVDASTSGAEISKLAAEAANLKEINRELSSEVIKYSSVSVIDENSETLGFVKPEKTVYLTPSQKVFAKLP